MDYLLLFPDWLWISTAAVLGLIVGSFINVVVHRLPKILMRRWHSEAQSIIANLSLADGEPSSQASTAEETKSTAPSHPYHLHWPPSHCPHCDRRLGASENIPLLSYLIQRGRCRGCRQSISPRYPAIELLSGTATATTVAALGATPQGFAIAAVTWLLIAAAAIDYECYLLPDALTIPLLWTGLLWSAVPLAGAAPPTPQDAIFGAVSGYLSLWLIYHAHHAITGREGMGYGDFKITAALGAWLGWQSLPMLILCAAAGGLALALALALGSRPLSMAMPFGPLLAAAGWYLLVFGDPIGAWPQVY